MTPKRRKRRFTASSPVAHESDTWAFLPFVCLQRSFGPRPFACVALPWQLKGVSKPILLAVCSPCLFPSPGAWFRFQAIKSYIGFCMAESCL